MPFSFVLGCPVVGGGGVGALRSPIIFNLPPAVEVFA